MNDLTIISVEINGTPATPVLDLEIWLDDKLVHNVTPEIDTKTFSIEVNDNIDAEHELKFVLKNKTQAHTTVDESGNILKDSTVEIKNIKFDEVELGNMFSEQAVYRHNFNGNSVDIEDEFYGTMGCNGSVVLKFTTPMYLWLLENM